ncbi:DUF4832 domain-containing protein [Peterkaempfera bronchialis]|uniref:DUF4832 domain-containing protein n=1 Tax=Peterkaempfera bronchialis TaxID=2126346 RepID=A0A345SSU4_9ACTN|nr:DUF4832 domain-containing protein [Peterkaempfera bronchialis]AXI76799.1 DUF4832 domain-containing protein [Peterkaempfera bronchialis]
MTPRRVVSLLALLATLLFCTALPATAAQGGPPPRPPVSSPVDSSLATHSYGYADTPVGQPMKGIAPYLFPGDNYDAKFPGGVLWSYFALNEVMKDPSDCNTFDWTIFDKALDEAAVWGRQLAFRFYVEYPGGTASHPANGIPPCLNGKAAMRTNGFWGTVSPDYDDPHTIEAFTNFVNAFAARYDRSGPGGTADPRIAFMTAGLVGLWGEWHTWPYDRDTSDGYPDLFPTDATVAKLVGAFSKAIRNIPVEIRYGDLAGLAGASTIGLHDDSWDYKEFRDSGLGGMTLPQSMGGWSDAFLQRALDGGTENRWTTASVGGEARPEIQGQIYSTWPGGSGQVDNTLAATELTHVTWMINQTGAGSYSTTDPKVAAGVRRMGYNLYVPHADFNSPTGSSLKVGVTMQNDGVAPFYQPWTVQLGLQDAAGKLVRSWDTPWDLRTVQPLKIRAFPDWNVGADPTYLDYGRPVNFGATVDTTGVPAGSYTLVMRVHNPLDAVTPQVLKSRPAAQRLSDDVISHYRAPYPLMFANANQRADGWLNLGSLGVGGGGGGDTTPPTAPTLTATGHTAASVSLSWSGATDNVGVTGYDVYRSGSLVGSTASTTYTDTGLTAGTAYSYTVRARDAAGNVSADSNRVTVTTDTGSGGSSGGGDGGTPPTGLVVDNFDGTPPYPSSALNDLGRWTGGNSFLNGGGAGEVTGGALVLQYSNGGWFGSDIYTDVSDRHDLVLRLKGAHGGEEGDFQLSLGGVTKVFKDFVLADGSHPKVTGSFTDIRIPLAANGINASAPGQLSMGFWYGGSSTLSIDSLSFQ